MTILDETARLAKEKLAAEYEAISVERVVIGVFFSGIKLSNGCAGISYTPVKDVPEAVCCPSSAGRFFDPFKIKGMPAAGGSGYHFFDKLAPRVVIEKPT